MTETEEEKQDQEQQSRQQRRVKERNQAKGAKRLNKSLAILARKQALQMRQTLNTMESTEFTRGE